MGTIGLKCRSCGRGWRVSDEDAGKTGACPACGAGITVPMPIAPIEDSTSPELPPATGSQGVTRVAIKCVYCGATIDQITTWPPRGDSTPFQVYAERPVRGAYHIQILCPHCGRRLWVVWQGDPT